MHANGQTLIGAVMTAAPLSVSTDCTIREARLIMQRQHVRHLAVSDATGFVSVLSREDIQRVTAPAHIEEEEDLRVGDVCEPRAHMADVGDPLDRVLRTMADDGINAVLVMKEGELAGIFTTTDVCRLLADHLESLT